MHRIVKGALIAATSLVVIGAGSAAHASVEVTDGYGFVGKGDVQSVMNWNNKNLQDAVDGKNGLSVTFTIQQSGTKAYSQTASQTATEFGTQSASQTGYMTGEQTGTQEVKEVLTCTKNGNVNQKFRSGTRSDTREDTVTDTVTATRTATRDGSRDGLREGSLAGVVNGTVVSAIQAPARKTGQWTGWNLEGLKQGVDPTFAPTGDILWDEEATFGAWKFDEKWSFEPESFDFPEYDFDAYEFDAYEFDAAIVWGEWDTNDTNADPDVCESNGNGISNVVSTVTERLISESDVTSVLKEDKVDEDEVMPTTTKYEDVKYGPTVVGDVTTSGSAALFVNGKALPNTPVAVPVV